MSTSRIVEAFQSGMTEKQVVTEFGITLATARRLNERIVANQPHRIPGSGRKHSSIGSVSSIRKILLRGPDNSSKDRLWTSSSLQVTLNDTLSLELSIETIRRRLSRSGLNPEFMESEHRFLKEQVSPSKRATYLRVGSSELDLKRFTARPKYKDSAGSCLHVLYAADRRGKTWFRCFTKPITSKNRIDFLEALLKHYDGSFLICGFRESVSKDVRNFMKSRSDDLLMVRISENR